MDAQPPPTNASTPPRLASQPEVPSCLCHNSSWQETPNERIERTDGAYGLRQSAGTGYHPPGAFLDIKVYWGTGPTRGGGGGGARFTGAQQINTGARAPVKRV